MISDSERNFFEFYRCTGATGSATLINGNGYLAVSGLAGSWPQMIFDVDVSSGAGGSFENAISQAAMLHDIRFAVCNAGFFNSDDQEKLRNGKIFPVEVWTIMEAALNPGSGHQQYNNYKIGRISETLGIEKFCGLVNAELMKDIKVYPSLFQELVDKNRAEIYGLFMDQELVSGLLSFTGTGREAGFYFIVTDSRFRGRGLAAELISRVMMLLFERGIDKVVLQAVPKAVSLYARLGFVPKGKLVILWKQ